MKSILKLMFSNKKWCFSDCSVLIINFSWCYVCITYAKNYMKPCLHIRHTINYCYWVSAYNLVLPNYSFPLLNLNLLAEPWNSFLLFCIWYTYKAVWKCFSTFSIWFPDLNNICTMLSFILILNTCISLHSTYIQHYCKMQMFILLLLS